MVSLPKRVASRSQSATTSSSPSVRHWATISPDGAIIVNTSETTNMLHWIDTQTRELKHNTLVGQRPRHVEFMRTKKLVWASAEIGGTVHVIDVDTKEQVKEFGFKIRRIHPNRIQPVGIRFSSDEKLAFVALGPANHVAVVETETFEIIKYLLVGRRVWHLDITPDGKYLFSTNGVSGDVTVIDVPKLKPVKSIKVGRFPWGVRIKPG